MSASFRDLLVIEAGSVALLAPKSGTAESWLRANCQSEPWQWHRHDGEPALVVESSYASWIVNEWSAFCAKAQREAK